MAKYPIQDRPNQSCAQQTHRQRYDNWPSLIWKCPKWCWRRSSCYLPNQSRQSHVQQNHAPTSCIHHWWIHDQSIFEWLKSVNMQQQKTHTIQQGSRRCFLSSLGQSTKLHVTQILQPFKVGHGDTTGITKHVGHNNDTLLFQEFGSSRSNGT